MESHGHKVTWPKYVCHQCGARGPNEEQENHQANCSLKNLLNRGSVPSRDSRIVGDLRTVANRLLEFLEANKFELKDPAERFRPLWETRSSGLFFIDTEYSRDLLVEICVMTTHGEIIIDAIIDHGTQIQILYDQLGIGIERSTVKKVYRNERHQNTSGMTLKQNAETLITKGFNSSSTLVEWSLGRCDYLKLFRVFYDLGLEYFMPPKENSWLFQ